MACRNAEGLAEAADARARFVNAVQALHCALARDVAPLDPVTVM